jgi:hypothetical protein
MVARIAEHAVKDCVESVIPWIAGIGNGVTLSVLGEVDPPPGAGFVTNNLPVPLLIRSAAERAT